MKLKTMLLSLFGDWTEWGAIPVELHFYPFSSNLYSASQTEKKFFDITKTYKALHCNINKETILGQLFKVFSCRIWWVHLEKCIAKNVCHLERFLQAHISKSSTYLREVALQCVFGIYNTICH